MDDAFGQVSSLFEEFEKDRESTSTFITYDKTVEGKEDRSKIVFRIGESDSESSSSESDSEDESESNHRNPINNDEGCSEDLKTVVNGTEEPVFKHEKYTEHQLIHEKNTFQRFARILDSTRHVPDEWSPACQVVFQNNSFSRKYRPVIENFINSLVYRHMHEGDDRMPELPLKSSTLTCVDINKSLPVTLRNDLMWRSHAIIGCAQFHRYFLVDTLGWTLVDYNPSLTDGWERPNYEQVYSEALPVEVEDENAPPKGPERVKASCFNCGGDHMMPECKEPKDFQRIKQNRNAFLEQQSASKVQRLSSVRYHQETDDYSENSKLRPGHISKELRKALGLLSDQLPPYIYKMRVMGYPPGWLEEAKVQTSGLAMFDRDGKEVVSKEDMLEDGEVKEKNSPAIEVDFDMNRIIEYPGFTVPVPEDCIDESEDMGFPPIQPHQLKATLQAQKDKKDSSRKRQAEFEEEIDRKKFKESAPPEEDMDLEDEADISISNGHFAPPLPVNTPPARPPLPDGTPPPTPENGPLVTKGLFLPPLPVNTPPGKPPIPDGTPPPTPEERGSLRLPPPKNPSFLGETPPDTPDSDKSANPLSGKSITRQNTGSSRRQTSSASSASSSERERSPSLEDLEKQYQLLQQKLEENEDTGTVELQVLDSVEDEDEDLDIRSEYPQLQRQMTRQGSSTSINTFGELGSGSPQHSLPGTPVITPSSSFSNLSSIIKGGSVSISKDFGTPILTGKPGKVDSLPDAVKFSDGIEDHIPFENLPDSTGTFEKMRGLISRIREKISFRKKKS